MATKDAELLLFGKVGDTLPPLRSRVVRIFTSSTFTDTSVERNALMSEIYPKIKDYCKTNYGLEFQVVDMRWGVRDEATDDHMTSQLCMNEIKACQKLSTGPNFVTFLCQKYGYRPFPPKIPADEFEAMRDVLNGDGKSVDILNDWFQKDANAVPPIYILQPISSKLIHFNDNDHPDKMTEDRNKWWEIFETLQAQLRDAAATCLKNGKFNAQQEAKYKISVTHDEVVHGILGQNTDKKEDHCVCFVRKFQDLESKSDNKEAKNFIDINWEDGKVDEEAKQLLTQLRDEQVPASLNKTNVVISSLNNWSEKGVDLDIPEHKQYLEKFLKTFYETIVELIERAVEKDKSHISNHPMYEEILQHLEFCKVKCQSFHGRGDLLLNIKNYIQERISGNSQNASPMIVYGESGSGKTSLVAKAAFQSATEWFGQGKSAVILRFLGTTPASTGVRQLIKSVCQQILTIYGHGDTKLPDDYFQVVRWFSKVLRYATHDKPLVIFLDSLDQLSAAEGAHRMAWLPKYLPPHVAILVSTLPKEHGILNTLQNILPSMEGAVEVKQLSVEESMHIIQSWLQSEKRTTNSEQQGIISTAIQQCSLPLFLKLLFDQASSWQSYLPSSKINVQPSVKGMIAVIFDRLEEYHGKALVSHALSYMTISQNGIGEAELEDLLSLDDEVLQDVYAYWLPPTRRIPPLLWTRIRADINDYLVEREAEGSRVIFWYHRQFIEAAAERYLHDAEFVKRLHIMCAQYFLGNWSGGKKKPFHYTSEQMNKFNKTRKEDEEDRKVAPQPYIFQAGSGATQYNVRKLEQLPYHLIHSNDVKKLKEHTLCNYEFILNKLMGMNLAEVLQDFTMAIAKYEDDDDIQMVSDTIRVGSSALRENPYHLIFEIIGRLKDSKSPHLIKLVSDAEKATTDQLALVPYNQCYPAPGGLLRTQLIGHTDEVLAVATTFDGRYLISGSRDTTAIVWELESSSIHHTLKGQHKSPISDLVITPDDLMVITYCYTTEQEDDRSTEINVWNIETGEHFLKLEGHSSQGTRPIRYTPDSKFAVSDMYDERVEGCTYVREYYFIVWSLENGRPLYQRVEAHKDTINDIAVARSQQGRYLVVTCGHDEDPGIKIWDLLSGQHLTEIIDRSKLQHTACNAMGVSSNGRYVGFHFHRHAILDVYTDEFMYLTKEDCSSAQEVKFLYNDTEIFFKDYRSDYYYQYNVEAKTISRSGWFSGRVGGYMEKLFFTEDWKIIVSKNENADAGEVWKASKEKIGDGNDPCQHLCRLPHTKQVNDMCFVNIPQSTLAITGSSDNSIKVWNLDYLRRMQKKSEVKKGEGDDDDEDDDDEDDDSDHDDDANETYAERKPYFRRIVHRIESLDNDKRVAVIDNLGKTISLYDAMEGKLITNRKWEGRYDHALGGLATTEDGMKLFALGGFDLMQFSTDTLKPMFDEPREIEAFCSGLCISGDGSLSILIGGDSYADDLYFYDINKGWYLKQYDPDSRPGNIFLLSGNRMMMPCSNNLVMVDMKTGKDIYDHKNGDYCICGAVSKNEKILITGWENGFIRLYDVGSGTLHKEILAHGKGGDDQNEDMFTEINLSSRDEFFVTASNDKTAKIWDMTSLRLIYELKGHANTVMKAKITADDQFVLTAATSEMNVKAWSVRSGELLTNISGYSPIDAIHILHKTNRVVITTADDRALFFKVNELGQRKPTHQQKQAPPQIQRQKEQAANMEPVHHQAPPPQQQYANQQQPQQQAPAVQQPYAYQQPRQHAPLPQQRPNFAESANKSVSCIII